MKALGSPCDRAQMTPAKHLLTGPKVSKKEQPTPERRSELRSQEPHGWRNVRISAPGEECWKSGAHVLSKGRGACLLVATAVDSRTKHLLRLLEHLHALCTTHRWIRVALNLFDTNATQPAPGLVHSCISVSRVPSFKTLFWKHILSPTKVASDAYSHLWLLDSDMNIHPANFDVLTFVRIAEATNVSILSPAPWGGGNGRYNMAERRCIGPPFTKCNRACSVNPATSCSVCRQSTVEVKAPLFPLPAWISFHRHVLAKIPDSSLETDYMIDLYWCNLLQHLHHGCDPRNETSTCHSASGAACAYSYVTPMEHLDDRTRGVRFLKEMKSKTANVLQRVVGSSYMTMPSYRPRGTLLDTHSCWSLHELVKHSPKLQHWTLPPGFAQIDWAARRTDADMHRKNKRGILSGNNTTSSPG
mmetsp:Transcript_19933/g.50716  ORF Transcript_19933/g.50716 Transcript_19933/m.50716 type:complete len:416 (+) Transcript_19933:475-1722(+)